MIKLKESKRITVYFKDNNMNMIDINNVIEIKVNADTIVFVQDNENFHSFKQVYIIGYNVRTQPKTAEQK